jgi:hypothetical protein
MLTNEELRKIVVASVNRRSRENFRKKKESLQEYIMYSYEEKELLGLAEYIEMTQEESCIEFDCIKQDNSQEYIEYSDGRLIERANELIEIAYEDDKWHGRDVSGLLTLLFNRISPELGAKFEAS